MDNNETLGSRACISLIVINIINILLCGGLNILTKISGSAALINCVYISLVTFIFFFIITKIYKPFHGLDIIDIAFNLGGNVLKIFVGISYITYFFILTSLVLRQYSEHLKAIYLHYTPLIVIILFFLVAIIFAAKTSIKVLSRVILLIVPISLLSIVFLLLACIPNLDLTHFLPILGNGPKSVFLTGFTNIYLFCAINILFLISPYIKDGKKYNRIGYISIGITAIYLIITTFIFLQTYPYPLASQSYFPMYWVARIAQFTNVLQRAEAIFLIIWTICAFAFLSLNIVMIITIFNKTFKTKKPIHVTFPFAIVLLIIALIPKDLSTIMFFEDIILRYTSVALFFLSIVVLIIARIKKRNMLQTNISTSSKGGNANE